MMAETGGLGMWHGECGSIARLECHLPGLEGVLGGANRSGYPLQRSKGVNRSWGGYVGHCIIIDTTA